MWGLIKKCGNITEDKLPPLEKKVKEYSSCSVIIQCIALAAIFVVGCIIFSKGSTPCPSPLAKSELILSGTLGILSLGTLLLDPKRNCPLLIFLLYSIPCVVLSVLAGKSSISARSLGYMILIPPSISLALSVLCMGPPQNATVHNHLHRVHWRIF